MRAKKISFRKNNEGLEFEERKTELTDFPSSWHKAIPATLQK